MAIPWSGRRRPRALVGQAGVANARVLADAERELGEAPPDCAWLDARTVDDLELPLVFEAIDRTTTVVGAQALWRWLAAPARARAVIADRAARIARFADATERERLRHVLGGMPISGAEGVAELLWGRDTPSVAPWRIALPLGAMALFGLLALWWSPALLGCALVFTANVLLDDWANLRLARHARALGVLGGLLDTAEHVAALAGEPADDLGPLAALRRRISLLSVTDPFGLLDVIRAGLLVRLLVLITSLGTIERERARLRRIILWVGELDAAISVAALRAERPDTCVPELVDGAPQLAGRALVHPVIEKAVGNDVELGGGGLLVTGSNMSGKSTFLRTVAINAICAQAIATTFGTWRGTLFRVHAAMRVADDTARGQSTFAVEVAAIGALVAEARAGAPLAALFVLDEPFRGTNPTIRVPIVVSVVEYLGARDFALVATHDLDVAAQLHERFARGYFGDDDHRLRPGVAPSQNALALLLAAHYPDAIVADVRRRTAAAEHGMLG